jgi:hypothetical protein
MCSHGKDALLEAQRAMAFVAFRRSGDIKGNRKKIVFRELVKWSGTPRFAAPTRLTMELADLPGHPARRVASRHKKLLEAHRRAAVVEILSNGYRASAHAIELPASLPISACMRKYKHQQVRPELNRQYTLAASRP